MVLGRLAHCNEQCKFGACKKAKMKIQSAKEQKHTQIIEGSLEVKLPTIWTVEKQR